MVRRLVSSPRASRSEPRTRAATLDDLDFVRELSDEVFREFGDYGGFLPAYLSHPSVFSTILESADDGLALGRRLGFVMIALVLSEQPLPALGPQRSWADERWLDAEILAIAVVPGEQARGRGRLLIQHAIDFAESWARSTGVRSLQLNVAETNRRAYAFFERHGFEVLCEDDGAYPRGQRSIRMVRRLGAGEG
jgi:ribosomal protein S18 acetylase RimI-like enzyme